MPAIYQIQATSQTTQQTLTQINLMSEENNAITDYATAKLMSDTFAEGLNRNRKEHAVDWVGTPHLIETGGATIPGVEQHNIVYNQQL